MVRPMAIPPTVEENAFADEILRHSNCQHTGLLTAEAAVEVFNRSGLSRYELRDIWGLADGDANGVLSKVELIVALRVMGWVQNGKRFTEALVDKPGPLPTIQGIAPPRPPENEASSSSPQQFPSVLPVDVQRFHEMFVNAAPVDGYLEGDAVRELYMKSDLSYRELSGVWNLADRKQTGHLTFQEFGMGMYLIEALKSCRLPALPASLPEYLFEQFEVDEQPTPESQSPPLAKSPFLTPNESPSQQLSRSLSSLPQAPPRSPYLSAGEGPSMSRSMRLPASPVTSKSPKLPPKPPPPKKPKALSKPWAITPTQKAEYDSEFRALDTEGTGLVPEEKALRSLRRYQLPSEDLAHIWDLAAIRNDNHFNSDEFAVAMYLVQDRLAGKEIPFELPRFLVPPSLRSDVSSPQASLSFAPPTPTSPKSKARDADPPFPMPWNGFNGAPPVPPAPAPSPSAPRRHRSTISSPAFIAPNLAESPTEENDHVPPLASPALEHNYHPPSRSPSTRVQMPLGFLTENPGSREMHRRRASFIGSGSSSSVSTPFLEDDPIEELRTETKTLRKQVDTLLQQLSSQNDYRTQNDELRKENGDLKTKIGELETNMASILTQMQSNDNALSEELTREIKRLTRRVGELEQTESQLQAAAGILEVTKRDNARLSNQVRELRAAEATHKVEMEAAQHATSELERENEEVNGRLADVMKAMSEPGDARASREVKIMLADVTKENQSLKGKLREMEKSMEQMLLSSRDSGRVDQLQRENRELKLHIQDLEQVTAQLQSQHEDSQLQQVLVAVTRENEGMKARIRDLQAGTVQTRTQHESRVADMQRRLDELAAENAQLKTQLQNTPPPRRGEDEEDMSVPPPAYDAIPPDIPH